MVQCKYTPTKVDTNYDHGSFAQLLTTVTSATAVCGRSDFSIGFGQLNSAHWFNGTIEARCPVSYLVSQCLESVIPYKNYLISALLIDCAVRRLPITVAEINRTS